jgi:hypothetical protein
MSDKIDPKKTIQKLIKQEGFGSVAQILGEVAKDEENLIRKSSDNSLRCAFETILPALIECFPRVGKRKQEFIKQIVGFIPVQESLKIVGWDSPNHCIAMKEACKTIKEWQLQ